jgi:hypothetical protein
MLHTKAVLTTSQLRVDPPFSSVQVVALRLYGMAANSRIFEHR